MLKNFFMGFDSLVLRGLLSYTHANLLWALYVFFFQIGMSRR